MAANGKRPVIAIAGNHDSPDRIEAPDPLARECGIIFAGYPNWQQEELLFLYSGYEKLVNPEVMRYYFKNLRKFMVIESAKNGELTMLGNGMQCLLWMANLAAEKYTDYWYYFDRSFSVYGLYDKLFSEDKKGKFRKYYNKLASLKHKRDEMFENIVKVLYPEVLAKQEVISA